MRKTYEESNQEDIGIYGFIGSKTKYFASVVISSELKQFIVQQQKTITLITDK